jgi:hypothetical protein
VEHVDRVWWRRALWRARRIMFSPLWWLSWPLRAAMPPVMTRAYAKTLAPGERVLAVDLSLGRSAEDYWIVTTRAVYICVEISSVTCLCCGGESTGDQSQPGREVRVLELPRPVRGGVVVECPFAPSAHVW